MEDNKRTFKEGVFDTLLVDMDKLLDGSEARAIAMSISMKGRKTISLSIEKE